MNARRDQDPESVVRDIRRNTRRKFSSEEKIRIVLEGLKGEVIFPRKSGQVKKIGYAAFRSQLDFFVLSRQNRNVRFLAR